MELPERIESNLSEYLEIAHDALRDREARRVVGQALDLSDEYLEELYEELNDFLNSEV